MAFRAATKTDSRLAARLAAIASVGAAVIHFAVVSAHWQEWPPSGLFFVSIALFQLIWARAMLARPITPVLAVGIMANVGAAALWVLSRTAGAPLGPRSGEPELVHAADLCALLLEIYVVMGAGWVWYRGRQAEPIPAFMNAVVLLGAGAVIALASTLGVASGLQHDDHHAPASAEPGHPGPSAGHANAHHSHPEPATPPPVVESIGTDATPAPTEAPPPPSQPLLDEAVGDHHHDD